jgi:hypothetical protein
MPILERAAPDAAPDTTTAAIEEIFAAMNSAAPVDDLAAEDAPVREAEPAGEADADAAVDVPRPRETFGHGEIRLRGRPV